MALRDCCEACGGRARSRGSCYRGRGFDIWQYLDLICGGHTPAGARVSLPCCKIVSQLYVRLAAMIVAGRVRFWQASSTFRSSRDAVFTGPNHAVSYNIEC